MVIGHSLSNCNKSKKKDVGTRENKDQRRTVSRYVPKKPVINDVSGDPENRAFNSVSNNAINEQPLVNKGKEVVVDISLKQNKIL